MAKQTARRPWWEELQLDKATARLVAERGAENPAELAAVARAVPNDFRRVFDANARTNLSDALAKHLEGSNGEAGHADLLAALEELSGKRPPKPVGKPPQVKFGVALAPGPDPKLPPLPKLGKLGSGH